MGIQWGQMELACVGDELTLLIQVMFVLHMFALLHIILVLLFLIFCLVAKLWHKLMYDHGRSIGDESHFKIILIYFLNMSISHDFPTFNHTTKKT